MIGVAVSDDLGHIRFSNRNASCLRNGFVLSQLDGEGMKQMERHQETAIKESHKEHLLKEIAKNTGANIHDLRNDSHQEMRTERVEKAVYFDTPQDDVPMTQTTGVQSDPQTDSTGVQAQAQTTSSGPQSPKTKMEEFGGTQTTRIIMKDKENQATEDRPKEIEQLRQASGLEKQALIAQHEQNIERVIQQVMAQAESEHSRQKEVYKQEFLKQSQIKEAEAQHIINQVQHQTQQEAQQYVGNVIYYAEQAHLNKTIAQRNKTEQADAKLNEKVKTKQTPNHNTTHRNEQTPGNRAKAKAKTEQSPPKTLEPSPPFTTGEKASGSQEKPKYDNPDSEHEPKGKPNRPPNVKTYNKTKPNPKHDTDKDENKTRTHWRKAKRVYIMYKLSKYGWT